MAVFLPIQLDANKNTNKDTGNTSNNNHGAGSSGGGGGGGGGSSGGGGTLTECTISWDGNSQSTPPYPFKSS